MQLWNYIKRSMLLHPNQKVREKTASMSYEELIVFAESFGAKLKGNEACAIYCRSEMLTAMALLSCIAAGVTAVPLSHKYSDAHYRKILRTISPTCIITDINDSIGIFDIVDSAYMPPSEAPALIMCTSGTTGMPKGVMLSQNNIITNLKDISSYFHMNDKDTIMISRPLYHAAVLTGEFLYALTRGTEIVFYSEDFNPIEITNIIKQERISVVAGTPTMFNLLTRFKSKNDDLGLKQIVISGEPMDFTTGKKIRNAFPRADIYHVYGLTEASPRVSYMPPEYFTDAPDCVGVPLPSVKIKILTDSGEEVKTNEYGMLYVKGDNIMLGYYNNKTLTNRILHDGWLCTGDIACINENGWLKIKGRSDDMIIRAGMNIYPQEIEAELKNDPRTDEVLVYGYDDAYGIKQIGMKISGQYENTKELRELCKKILPSYQMPVKIELVEKLERNGSGKVIRNGVQ